MAALTKQSLTKASTLMQSLRVVPVVESSECWKVVINVGPSEVPCPDHRFARFSSRLVRHCPAIKGDHLIEIPIPAEEEGGKALSQPLIDSIRASWTLVSELYPQVELFRGADFYRSPQVVIPELGKGLKFNFWYCGAEVDCAIHRDHDFFEVHTQILGTGEMQKFSTEEFKTMYERVVLSPGQTHAPFYSVGHDGQPRYPWHQYRSQSPCIWLAIEKQTPF